MKNKRKLHKWSKNDYIITFFLSKYNKVGKLTEKEISEVIGTSTESVKKMMSNFRHLMGYSNELSHIKNLQWEVYEEYNNKPMSEFFGEVRNMSSIIDRERKLMLNERGVKNYRFIGRREKS